MWNNYTITTINGKIHRGKGKRKCMTNEQRTAVTNPVITNGTEHNSLEVIDYDSKKESVTNKTKNNTL